MILSSSFVAYGHTLGFMVLVACLVMEHMMVRDTQTERGISKLAVVDLIYGLSVLLVVTTGILRLFFYGKGVDFYLHNGIFHTKITLFVIIALLSIYTTKTILGSRKRMRAGNSEESIQLPKSVAMIIRVELLLVVLLPLLAALIARGMGSFGS